MRKIIAIRRADRFSPNSVDKDRAILQSVIDHLQTEIEMIDEDDYAKNPVDADVIISMARQIETLKVLSEKELQGAKVVNSARGLLQSSRSELDSLMRNLQVSLPPTDGEIGFWLKRGDASAQSKDDVVFCKDRGELAATEAEFAIRGITDWIVQAHVEGDLVKWYAVGDSFFRYYYPSDDGNFKFDDEKRNGEAHHYAFNVEALQKEVALISKVTGISVYGGDAIIREDGSFCIIDFNDWPSFSRCREEAGEAIATLIKREL